MRPGSYIGIIFSGEFYFEKTQIALAIFADGTSALSFTLYSKRQRNFHLICRGMFTAWNLITEYAEEFNIKKICMKGISLCALSVMRLCGLKTRLSLMRCLQCWPPNLTVILRTKLKL